MTTETRYFIAVPKDPQGIGIFGTGTSADQAISDAYRQSGSRPPMTVFDEFADEADGRWKVMTTGTTRNFTTEKAAEAFADQHRFRASECTQRLYEQVRKNGAPAKWDKNGRGLDDLIEGPKVVEAKALPQDKKPEAA